MGTKENCYSLRPIILFINIDVSTHILIVDTSVLAKSNIGRREYLLAPYIVQILPPIAGILAYPSRLKDVRGLLKCGKTDRRHRSQNDGEEEVVAK
jgi:hypothetical protein